MGGRCSLGSLGSLELRGHTDVHTAWGGGGQKLQRTLEFRGDEQLSLEETLTMSE